MVEFLKQKGFLQPEQHDEALKVQQQTKEPDIGKVLVSLGFVGEREVLQARAAEQGIPFVDLDRIQIESSAINVVNERIAKNHSVIPVKKEGQQLWLAMSNTSNIQAIDDVRMASGCRVTPCLALPAAIEDALKKYYGGSAAAPTAAAPTPPP